MMIDVEKMNLDLKEGKAFYSTPFDMLTAEQLAKAYAWALYKFGESVQSRTVLDSICDKGEELNNYLKSVAEEPYTEDYVATLNTQIDDLENEVANLNSELNMHGSKL